MPSFIEPRRGLALRRSSNVFWLAVLLLAWSTSLYAATVDKPVPIRMLMDVRSTHSDGAYDMRELARMAKDRGIQVLGIVDHDRKGIRFGVDPVPGILGYTKDLRSLHTTGLAPFFADLKKVRRSYPDMTILAGTESISGYTWSGIPFKNLVLHNSERMLITLGEEKPEQIKALPSFTLRYVRGIPFVSIAFWSVLAIVVLIPLLLRRRWNMAGLLAALYAILIASLAMRPTIRPDVDLLDAAHKQGLFTVWAYPGTKSGVRQGPMGVKLDTLPYSRRVFTDPTADAFAAVYGDADSNTVPGGLWDMYLKDYMLGFHSHPIWAVSAGDFHRQGGSGEHLGNFPMDVWAMSNTPKAILAALRAGRMVAWRSPANRDLHVTSLYLQDKAGRYLLPGDEAHVTSRVSIHITIARLHPGPNMTPPAPLLTQIIIDGSIVAQLQIRPGASQQYALQLASGPHVIRLRIPDQKGVRMEANPFLVRVAG